MAAVNTQSLLHLRERELAETRAELCSNPHIDWFTKNKIAHLERMVKDIRARLNERGDHGKRGRLLAPNLFGEEACS